MRATEPRTPPAPRCAACGHTEPFHFACEEGRECAALDCTCRAFHAPASPPSASPEGEPPRCACGHSTEADCRARTEPCLAMQCGWSAGLPIEHCTLRKNHAGPHSFEPAPAPSPSSGGSEETAEARCYDCGRRYGDEYGFPDLVVTDDVWRRISPTGHEGGLLCPSCMARRAHRLGLTDIPARFTSGPFAGAPSAVISVKELTALRVDAALGRALLAALATVPNRETLALDVFRDEEDSRVDATVFDGIGGGRNDATRALDAALRAVQEER